MDRRTAAILLLIIAGHIGFLIVRRACFPGGVTALLLVPVSGQLMVLLASGA